MLLLTPLSWLQIVVAEGVKKLLEGLNFFVRWVEQLPYASIDGIWLYQSEILGIYIVGFLLTYYFMNRRYRNLLICLFSILSFRIMNPNTVAKKGTELDKRVESDKNQNDLMYKKRANDERVPLIPRIKRYLKFLFLPMKIFYFLR